MSTGTYLFWAGVMAFCLLFCITNITETKGMPLEKMDIVFNIDSWAAYWQYIKDNVRYKWKRHLKEYQKVTINRETATSAEGTAMPVHEIQLTDTTDGKAVDTLLVKVDEDKESRVDHEKADTAARM
jgi:hypothetical protein